MFRPRARYFPAKESTQSSPGLRPRTRSAYLLAHHLRPARGKPNGLDFLPRSLRAALAVVEPFALIDERLSLVKLSAAVGI